MQALHTIQEVKRKDGYLGTYPIVRANDGHSNCVFLDERAIVKLNEYLKNPEKDKPRDTNDSYYYGAFDSAIPVIREEWKKCTNNYTVPLLIGDDAYTLNNMTTSTIRYTNSANINLVLDYCKKIDPGLDISLVKQRISEKYQQNTVIYDYGVFSFDGAISAKFLISVILECSSKLKKLLMLNSQGGCNLDNKFYKISEIKQVLNDQELLVLASCVQNYNVTIETSNLSNLTIEERNQHVDMQLQCRGVQLKRKQKLLFAQKKYTIDQSVEKACEDQPLDYQEVLNSVKRRCEETKQDKIKALQITDDSEFAKIKDEFLNALDPKPEVFSSTTIGMYLSEHADSLYFCYNLDIAENSAAVRFYNEGVSLMALIHSNSSEW